MESSRNFPNWFIFFDSFILTFAKIGEFSRFLFWIMVGSWRFPCFGFFYSFLPPAVLTHNLVKLCSMWRGASQSIFCCSSFQYNWTTILFFLNLEIWLSKNGYCWLGKGTSHGTWRGMFKRTKYEKGVSL